MMDEPRKFWIVNYDATSWDTQKQAEDWAAKLPTGSIIHACVQTEEYTVDHKEASA